MRQTIASKTPRIEVVDALRGFAVMAILLVHNLEHFYLSCISRRSLPTGMAQYPRRRGIQCNIFFYLPGKRMLFLLCFSG